MENFKPVSASQTTITELMIPSHANFGGKVHGGIILSMMDKVAYACAAKHSAGYNVTASMNGVDFLAPVEVGNLLHLHASVNFVGSSSMVIGIRVEAEDIHTGKITHTNSSYMTMVAMNEDKTTRKVPGLILETDEDVRRFLQAIKRRKLIKTYKQKEAELMENFNLDQARTQLDGQNCIILK